MPIDVVSATLLAGEDNGQDVKARDTVKVPDIGCSNAPSGSCGSRGDEPVVCADVCPAAASPAQMRRAHEWREGREQRANAARTRLDEGLTPDPVLGGSPVYAMQQLRGRDGGDPDLFVGPQLLLQGPTHFGHGVSRRQVAYGAFKLDEDGGV
jgi:hypothetical protein